MASSDQLKKIPEIPAVTLPGAMTGASVVAFSIGMGGAYEPFKNGKIPESLTQIGLTLLVSSALFLTPLFLNWAWKRAHS
jgi:hypothetical protein